MFGLNCQYVDCMASHKEFVTHFFLQDIMNFTYTLRKPPDGQWGSLTKNGTWTGMVNELLHKKADIGMDTFQQLSLKFYHHNI